MLWLSVLEVSAHELVCCFMLYGRAVYLVENMEEEAYSPHGSQKVKRNRGRGSGVNAP